MRVAGDTHALDSISARRMLTAGVVTTNSHASALRAAGAGQSREKSEAGRLDAAAHARPVLGVNWMGWLDRWLQVNNAFSLPARVVTVHDHTVTTSPSTSLKDSP